MWHTRVGVWTCRGGEGGKRHYSSSGLTNGERFTGYALRSDHVHLASTCIAMKAAIPLLWVLVTPCAASTICTYHGTDTLGNTIAEGSLCDGTYAGRELVLSNNQSLLLSGTIPRQLRFLGNLRRLTLSSMTLSGTVPSEIGEIGALLNLSLNSNPAVSGPLPPQLGNLTRLEELHLWGNANTLPVRYNKISGTIPSSLGKLQRLQNAYLNDNILLSGTIPSQIGQLDGLNHLYLDHTLITGTIPCQIGRLSCEELSLSRTSLAGTIPTQVMRRVLRIVG